jgi:uncharacterized protein with WD repeat
MFKPVYNNINENIDWTELSSNPNAIPLLEKNLYKVNWINLSANPNAIHLLCKLDTKSMQENCKYFAEELIEYVFHPGRLIRISEQYKIELSDYLELL